MRKGLGILLGSAIFLTPISLNNPLLKNNFSIGCKRPSYETVKRDIETVHHKIIESIFRQNLNTQDLLTLKGELLVSYGEWYDGVRTATNELKIDPRRFGTYSLLSEKLQESFDNLNLLLGFSNVPREEIENLNYFSNKLGYISKTGLIPK